MEEAAARSKEKTIVAKSQVKFLLLAKHIHRHNEKNDSHTFTDTHTNIEEETKQDERLARNGMKCTLL